MAGTCFFDEIIKCLRDESEISQYAEISESLLKKIYSGVPEKKVRGKKPTPGNTGVSPLETAEKTVYGSIDEISKDADNKRLPIMKNLKEKVSECVKCGLHKERRNTVFGAGPVNAELMFIGEGPGEDEDIQGLPFVGRAGQLLTKMITAMRFDRNDVYIANIVKCRPPNNRNPSEEEAAQCIPYLEKQIEIIKPKSIVLLGAVPARYILKVEAISKVRGTWQEYKGIRVMPTYHPAYLLRNPAAKKDVWEDLKKVMKFFGKQI